MFVLFCTYEMELFDGLPIATIIFILLIVFILYSTLKTVPQGYHWTIERFGRYIRTLTLIEFCRTFRGSCRSSY